MAKNPKFKINSAYSAQGSTARPNPFVSTSINYILDNRLAEGAPKELKIADQGCGKLRHLNILIEYFDNIYLIETVFQLTRVQTLFAKRSTINEYITDLDTTGKRLAVISAPEFDDAYLNLDIVFNFCAFDVEVPQVRKAMGHAAFQNLKSQGLYVLVIPSSSSKKFWYVGDENSLVIMHRIQPFQLVPRVRDREAPINRGLATVAFGFPGGDFAYQDCRAADAPV